MGFNLDVPEPEYIETDEQARELLRLATRKVEEDPEDLIGFDTETHGKVIPVTSKGKKPLDWMNDTVVLWSLSFDVEGYRRWCIQQQHFQYFAGLLENPDTWLTAWNAKYDAHVSWNSGVNIWEANVVDGLALVSLFDENRRVSGLKKVADDYCGLAMTPYTELFKGCRDVNGKLAVEFKTSLLDLPRDRVSNYASYDAYACLRAAEYLVKELKEIPLGPDTDRTMWDHYLDIEMDFTEILWRMERRGLQMDVGYLDAQLPKIDKSIAKLEKDINRVAGQAVSMTAASNKQININAPAQLAKLFFGDKKDGGLGLTPVKMTKGGATEPQPSVDKDVMAALEETTELAAMIVECRSLQKTRSTYLLALRDMAVHFEKTTGAVRIHPSFNQFGARTGRLSTKGPNCFDGETEILTSKGWIRADQLDMQYKVAQWRPEGDITFIKPLDVIHEPYTGPMVTLLNQHIDLVLTPDHRCPLLTRKDELVVEPASVYSEDRKQLHSGLYSKTKDAKSFDDDFIRLLVAIQADGSWVTNTTKLRLDIGFNRERKAKRMRSLLNCVGADFTCKEDRKKKHNKFRFKVIGDAVYRLHKYLGDDRTLGPWLLKFSLRQLTVFCDELHHWDGCFKLESMYSSSVKTNADWAQIALTLCGRRAKIREYMPKSGRVNYQVDTVKRDFSWTTNIHKSSVQSPGVVHCLTVPSGFVVVRRNGKACISGQSQNFPRPDGDIWGIRQAFIAPPGKKLIVADYAQLEMRIMADQSGDKVMIKAISEGKDLHSFTASRMLPGVQYEDVVAAKKAEKPDKQQKILIRYRQDSKPVGFGIIYGAGPPTISKNIKIPDSDILQKINETPEKKMLSKVKRMIKKNPLLTEKQAVVKVAKHAIAADKIAAYFKVFPGVKTFMGYVPELCRDTRYTDFPDSMDYAELQALKEIVVDEDGNKSDGRIREWGFVQTLFGRYRRLEDIDHSNRMYKGHAEREAVNTKIQGTAADIVKGAMLRCEKSKKLNKLGALMLNQIHDELVFEVPEENAEEAGALIKKYMENPLGKTPALCVPLPVDMHICDLWSEGK
jgi:DNA polymerase I-like protein with 3'-5' exonuclease and polymerase domains